jgi:hypothetical protein
MRSKRILLASAVLCFASILFFLYTLNINNAQLKTADPTALSSIAKCQFIGDKTLSNTVKKRFLKHNSHEPIAGTLPNQDSNLTDLIAIIKDRNISAEEENTVYELVRNLSQQSVNNPTLQDELIQLVLAAPSSQIANALVESLAPIKSQKIEALGTTLLHAQSNAEKLTGMNILSQQINVNPDNFQTIKSIISENNNDTNMTLAAIEAMPNTMLAKDYSDSLKILSELSQSDQENVRIAAFSALSHRANDMASLQPIVNALKGQDKLEAALALKESNITDNELKNIFLSTMNNINEDEEVREVAASSLTRYQLNDDEYAVFLKFNREISNR